MYIVLHVPALCRGWHWWQQCLLCVLEIISQFTINIILNLLRKQTAFITTPPHPLALCSLHNVVLVTRLSCRHVTKQVVFIAALIIIHMMETARGKQVGRYRSRQLMIQVIFWFVITWIVCKQMRLTVDTSIKSKLFFCWLSRQGAACYR